MFNFNVAYNRNNFLSFLSKDFLPEDFKSKEENLNLDFSSKYAITAVRLGKCHSLDLEVIEITHNSTHDARVGISRDAFQLLLRKSYCNRALIAFVPEDSKNYRFSLLQIEAEQLDESARIFRSYSNPRRFSYFLGEDAHTKTPEQFLRDKGRIKQKDGDFFKDLLERFSVEVLTKQFYNELSNWYFWAIKNVSFPNDINDDSDDEKYNTENVIRLITRLIFTWFLKQKKLINPNLFDPAALSDILTHFIPESEKQSNYYRAILQNLFFATLNQEIEKRDFAEDKGFLENKSTNGIKNMYRYENEFSGDTAQIIELFSQVPFLNGGLFECLDGKEKEGKTFYWDGFSRNPKQQANIPNCLFFAKEQIVDISKEYNNKKMQTVKVSGIIEILNRYNFTVKENTPIEIEVALDPELLGKVFENLLGAFNPETQETARKQTGSFYTPREIVSYMVNESLIAYFKTNVPDLLDDTIRSLFSYEVQKIDITESQREALIQAAFNCKIIDPACGSGAFPMGILQQMVHVLGKLDADNIYWNKVVMNDAMKAFENAEELSDEDRKLMLEEIERTFYDNVNHPDYARKLHLIENCIYGVDIQSIAVQISKLRFFISLVCEQEHNKNSADNYGIRPLPNLETKFVTANTLIGIEKNEEDMSLFREDKILKLVKKLEQIRHRQFLVTNSTQKKDLRVKDEALRQEIVTEVQKLYVKREEDNLSKYKMQLKLTEKEFELLKKRPDDIRTKVSTDLFGGEKVQTFNFTESKRVELKTLINRLNKQIDDGSKYSRLESVVILAKQLTSWDPYDQNASSPFFDPEWMFGLTKENAPLNSTENGGYFDVVIGNPPYGAKLENIKKYKELFPETSIGNIDSYKYFIHKGLKLIHNSGSMCYITSDSYLEKEYFTDLRNLIVKRPREIGNIKLGDNVFENVNLPTAILLLKNSNISHISYSDVSMYSVEMKIKMIEKDNVNVPYSINFTGKKSFFKIQKYKELIDLYDQVMGVKVYQIGKGKPKQTKFEIENNSFVSDFKDGNEWLPFIDSGIKRYEYNSNVKYIKYGEWLAEQRDIKFFKNPKVLIREVVNPRIFSCYVETECVVKNTAAVVIQKLPQFDLMFLLGLLNSKFFNYYISTQSPKSNNKTFPSINSALIKKFQIPVDNEILCNKISNIVKDILHLKQVNNQFSIVEFDNILDKLVYELYRLSEEEIKLIESN